MVNMHRVLGIADLDASADPALRTAEHAADERAQAAPLARPRPVPRSAASIAVRAVREALRDGEGGVERRDGGRQRAAEVAVRERQRRRAGAGRVAGAEARGRAQAGRVRRQVGEGRVGRCWSRVSQLVSAP